MDSLLPTLLTFSQLYGYPALWIIVFLAGAGVPLPTDVLLLAIGALAAQGNLNIISLMLIATSAAACGDAVGYLVGRAWGSKAIQWLARSNTGSRVLSPPTLDRARSFFAQYGGWAVFLSRFLLGMLSGVINLLAGAEFYPYRSFFVFDVAGEAVDAVVMLSVGWIAGDSWKAAGDFVRIVSLLLLILLVVALLLMRRLRSHGHVSQSSGHPESYLMKDMRNRVSRILPSTNPCSHIVCYEARQDANSRIRNYEGCESIVMIPSEEALKFLLVAISATALVHHNRDGSGTVLLTVADGIHTRIHLHNALDLGRTMDKSANKEASGAALAN